MYCTIFVFQNQTDTVFRASSTKHAVFARCADVAFFRTLPHKKINFLKKTRFHALKTKGKHCFSVEIIFLSGLNY